MHASGRRCMLRAWLANSLCVSRRLAVSWGVFMLVFVALELGSALLACLPGRAVESHIPESVSYAACRRGIGAKQVW